MPNNRSEGSVPSPWFIMDEASEVESTPVTLSEENGIAFNRVGIQPIFQGEQPVMVSTPVSRDILRERYENTGISSRDIREPTGLSSAEALRYMQDIERMGRQSSNHFDGLSQSLAEANDRSARLRETTANWSLPDPRYGYVTPSYSLDGGMSQPRSPYESNSPTVSEFNTLVDKVNALLATITELKEDNVYLKAVLDEEFSIKIKVVS